MLLFLIVPRRCAPSALEYTVVYYDLKMVALLARCSIRACTVSNVERSTWFSVWVNGVYKNQKLGSSVCGPPGVSLYRLLDATRRYYYCCCLIFFYWICLFEILIVGARCVRVRPPQRTRHEAVEALTPACAHCNNNRRRAKILLSWCVCCGVSIFFSPCQTVAEVLMRAEKTTLAELTRLVQRDQGIMGVSRAGKTRTTVTVPNVGHAHGAPTACHRWRRNAPLAALM